MWAEFLDSLASVLEKLYPPNVGDGERFEVWNAFIGDLRSVAAEAYDVVIKEASNKPLAEVIEMDLDRAKARRKALRRVESA